jgi:hypothetical protein
MENKSRGRVSVQHAVVHCYDTRTHRIVCGAPGHIGSTKHARDVTCGECLAILREAAGSTLPTHEDGTATH